MSYWDAVRKREGLFLLIASVSTTILSMNTAVTFAELIAERFYYSVVAAILLLMLIIYGRKERIWEK